MSERVNIRVVAVRLSDDSSLYNIVVSQHDSGRLVLETDAATAHEAVDRARSLRRSIDFALGHCTEA
jgi:hypothetical protein